jgi:hypothetical protein
LVFGGWNIDRAYAQLPYLVGAQGLHLCQFKPWRLEVAATKTKSACAD